MSENASGVRNDFTGLHGIVLFVVVSLLWSSSAPNALGQQSDTGVATFQLTGDIDGAHDPSIAEDHGMYYVFATGRAYAPRAKSAPAGAAGDARPQSIGQIPVRCSRDLHHWTLCGRVFPGVPAWIHRLSPATKDLWAPDMSYFDGLYHLYYSFSVFGKNTSGIALATGPTLDQHSPRYHWTDRGLVLQSTLKDDFNAIDPNLTLDRKGQPWLAFGSFWTGIKMRRLNRATGLLSASDRKVYSLAARASPSVPEVRKADLPPDSEAIEAPFVFRHGHYFYLFVSWDLCCRGVHSTYRTMVGRSKQVTGPYLDRNGLPMLKGGGSPLLSANGIWLGPGGESLLHLPGEDIIVFHAYSADDGHPALQISPVSWRDGWPEAMVAGAAKTEKAPH